MYQGIGIVLIRYSITAMGGFEVQTLGGTRGKYSAPKEKSKTFEITQILQ